jgi:hypothetical protein
MSTPDQHPDPAAPASAAAAPSSSRDLSPGGAARATTSPDEAEPQPPLKQHGDALLDGSGSRQGSPPEPELDAAPHE